MYEWPIGASKVMLLPDKSEHVLVKRGRMMLAIPDAASIRTHSLSLCTSFKGVCGLHGHRDPPKRTDRLP
eukprot:2931316-Amphidinium_carterae.1